MSQFCVPLLQVNFGKSLKLLRIVVETLRHVPDEGWCHSLRLVQPNIATGQKPDRDPTPEEQGKDPAAAELGASSHLPSSR
jgi:hypothetical protein